MRPGTQSPPIKHIAPPESTPPSTCRAQMLSGCARGRLRDRAPQAEAPSTERERTPHCVRAPGTAATPAPAVRGGLCHHLGVNPLDAGAIALLLLAILL